MFPFSVSLLKVIVRKTENGKRKTMNKLLNRCNKVIRLLVQRGKKETIFIKIKKHT